ncbi:MAG: mercuric reductase, partial [Myxococcaceae bacterium]|nr:mercuric reductase [Myxococcaceae bacterium]
NEEIVRPPGVCKLTPNHSAQATRQVDALVLGSGEAGKYLAWHLAQSGKRTVLIERRWVGGSCPNVNCLPSKNEVHSAKVAHTVRQAATFGVNVEGMQVDMQRVLARKREMVEGLVAMHLERFRTSGATSASSSPASRSICVALSPSTIASRPAQRTCGRSATAQAAQSSRTRRTTTSASCATTSQAAGAARTSA